MKVIGFVLTTLLCFVQAQDAPTAVALLTDPAGTALGTITFTDSSEGLMVSVAVAGLPPGKHGFHVHGGKSCDSSVNDQGEEVHHGKAGGHFDPYGTDKHAGPDVDSQTGHAGDLPNLEVAEDGTAMTTFTTTKMTVVEGETSLAGRTIIVHANEDNYTDEPKNGGSGDRIACGVITLQ
jgi:superoxide dismutase, Cu-Zn family